MQWPTNSLTRYNCSWLKLVKTGPDWWRSKRKPLEWISKIKCNFIWSRFELNGALLNRTGQYFLLGRAFTITIITITIKINISSHSHFFHPSFFTFWTFPLFCVFIVMVILNWTSSWRRKTAIFVCFVFLFSIAYLFLFKTCWNFPFLFLFVFGWVAANFLLCISYVLSILYFPFCISYCKLDSSGGWVPIF